MAATKVVTRRSRSYSLADKLAGGWQPKQGASIVGGYFPRKMLTSVFAHVRLGKTNLLIRVAADLSRGEFLGEKHERVRTFINAVEDDEDTIIGRALAAGADPEWIDLAKLDWQFPRDATRLEALLARGATENRPYGMVVLDAQAEHMQMTDEGQFAAARSLLRIAQRHNIAIVVIAHCLDKGGKTAKEAMEGSTAWQKLSKATYVFGKNPHVRDGFEGTKHRVLVSAGVNFADPPDLFLHEELVKVGGFGEPVVTLVPEIVRDEDGKVVRERAFSADAVVAASVKAATSREPDRVDTTADFILRAVLEAGGWISEERLVERAAKDGKMPPASTWKQALRKAELVKEDGGYRHPWLLNYGI